MSLELLFLGTGTSAGVPMIGCDCAVCRSSDPRDQRTRPSVMVSYHDASPPPEVVTHTNGEVCDEEVRNDGSAHKVSKPVSPREASEFAAKHALSPLDIAHISPHDGRVRRFIIDTAFELRQQIIRQRIARIDGVFYTHAHADHIFGLDDLRRFNAVMQAPIDIFAEQHTMDILRSTFWYIFEPHRNVNNSFVASLTPRTLALNQPVDLFGARWTPIRLLHGRLPILGFRVDLPDTVSRTGGAHPGAHPGMLPGAIPGAIPGVIPGVIPGGSLAYCTDVSSIPEESLPLLANLDVLVLDALRYTPHPTHLSIAQSLREVERIKPRQTYFTHMAHDVSHARLESELPANIRPAYDGLIVSVRRPL